MESWIIVCALTVAIALLLHWFVRRLVLASIISAIAAELVFGGYVWKTQNGDLGLFWQVAAVTIFITAFVIALVVGLLIRRFAQRSDRA